MKRFRIYGIVVNPRIIHSRFVEIDSGIEVLLKKLLRMVAVM